MKLPELLELSAAEIIDESRASVSRAGLAHYAALGPEQTRIFLETIYVVIVKSVKTKNITSIVKYSKQLARDRFSAGFGLYEVQTAFNVLEESIWKKVMSDLPPEDASRALGLVSTVMGAGKDALSQTFLELASQRRSPLLSVKELFKGTDGV
jgi:hypothetical protein